MTLSEADEAHDGLMSRVRTGLAGGKPDSARHVQGIGGP